MAISARFRVALFYVYNLAFKLLQAATLGNKPSQNAYIMYKLFSEATD